MATQRCAFIAAGNEVPDPFGIVRDFALKLDGPVRFMLLAAFIFYADFHPNRIHITPNAAAQARRARDACYGTETPSRRCLKPNGSATSSFFLSELTGVYVQYEGK